MGYRCRWRQIEREDYTEKADPIPDDVRAVIARCDIEDYPDHDRSRNVVRDIRWHRVTLDGNVLGWVKYSFDGQYAKVDEKTLRVNSTWKPFWHTTDPAYGKGIEVLLRKYEKSCI